MKKRYFRVKLLSGIVLQGTSNNEGKILPLDYIPGSNFLGIIARHYKEFDNAFDVFHSGKIRFGNATLIHEDSLSYKIPFSLFFPKLSEEKRLYNFHYLTEEDFLKLGQLKQKRSGYFTCEHEEIDVDFRYSQKSAYDTKKRKSKESQMYGYDAIESGKEFGFSIAYDEEMEEELEKILQYLLGVRRLGKSRSAEYGLVEISQWQYQEPNLEQKSDRDILYCKSRLVLFDENGAPTLDVKHIAPGLEIDYEKTQIRTVSFTPFNNARGTKDYQRIAIDHGSVIVLKKRLTQEQRMHIAKGVGAFKSEGFGEILINPSFLTEKTLTLYKPEDNQEIAQENLSADSDLIKFLALRKEKDAKEARLIQKAREFASKNRRLFKNITNSQWGTIRSLAKSAEYRDNIIEYVSKGHKQWDSGQIEILKTIIEDRELLQHVAVMMQRGRK